MSFAREVAETGYGVEVTRTLEVAVVPPSVVHPRLNCAPVGGMTGETTAPATLVLPACCSLQVAKSGLDIVHFCIPLVTHPIVDLRFSSSASDWTIFSGVATSTIVGLATRTVHCSLAVSAGVTDALVQVSP